MPTPALIREQTETDADGRLWFTGVFDVDVDVRGGRRTVTGWDAALAWATERAAVAYVDFEDGPRHTARGEDPWGDCSPLPDLAEAALREGRRRPQGDRWLDRTEADEPIEWEVVVLVDPDIYGSDVLQLAAALGERLVGTLRATQLDDVAWSDHNLVRFKREVVHNESGGWTFMGESGLEVTGRARAATHAPIARRVADTVRDVLNDVNHRMPHRVPDHDNAPAWDGEVDVHPPGYERPFGSSFYGIGTVDVPRDWR